MLTSGHTVIVWMWTSGHTMIVWMLTSGHTVTVWMLTSGHTMSVWMLTSGHTMTVWMFTSGHTMTVWMLTSGHTKIVWILPPHLYFCQHPPSWKVFKSKRMVTKNFFFKVTVQNRVHIFKECPLCQAANTTLQKQTMTETQELRFLPVNCEDCTNSS